MRLFGNYGTIHVGATIVGGDFYWKRQWTVFFKASSGTYTKTVKISDEDLSAFYIKGKCERGSMVLKMSQGSAKKDINLSGTFNEMVDLTDFRAGMIKMVVVTKAAENGKAAIGWRR